jgi:hypothetical protein
MKIEMNQKITLFALTLVAGFSIIKAPAQSNLNLSELTATKQLIQKKFKTLGLTYFDYANLNIYKEIITDTGEGLSTYYDQKIIPPIYSTIYGPPYNWLVAAKEKVNGRICLYNLFGEKVTPSIYEHFDIAVDVERIKSAKRFDTDLEATQSWGEYDDFALAYLSNQYILTDTTHKQGVISSGNEILIPFKYDEIVQLGSGRFAVKAYSNDYKMGIFDIYFKDFVLQEEYQDIKRISKEIGHPFGFQQSLYYNLESYYAVQKENKWRLLNKALEDVFKTEFDEIVKKDTYLVTKLNKEYAIHDFSGKNIVDGIKDRIYEITQHDGIVYFTTEALKASNFVYEFFDQNGNLIASTSEGMIKISKAEIELAISRIKDELPTKPILAYVYKSGDKGTIVFTDKTTEEIQK